MPTDQALSAATSSLSDAPEDPPSPLAGLEVVDLPGDRAAVNGPPALALDPGAFAWLLAEATAFDTAG